MNIFTSSQDLFSKTVRKLFVDPEYKCNPRNLFIHEDLAGSDEWSLGVTDTPATTEEFITQTFSFKATTNRLLLNLPSANEGIHIRAINIYEGVYLRGVDDKPKSILYDTAVPVADTWLDSDEVINRDSAVGQPLGWRNTVDGTLGTLVGVTGGITSATRDLVVNDASDLRVGQFITIVGVTGTKRIVTILGTAVTIDSTADATVAGAAVAFFAASFTALANL